MNTYNVISLTLSGVLLRLKKWCKMELIRAKKVIISYLVILVISSGKVQIIILNCKPFNPFYRQFIQLQYQRNEERYLFRKTNIWRNKGQFVIGNAIEKKH